MRKRIVSISICFFLLLTACTAPTAVDGEDKGDDQGADLVIYTPLTEDIYRPFIKEFQERNHINVIVHEEPEKGIRNKLMNKDSSCNCDLIFGITRDFIQENSGHLENYTFFCSIPFAIIYNSNLVTYHETVEGFGSLVEPYWKGRIGFVDPEASMIYKNLLNFMMNTVDNPVEYKNKFLQNMDGDYATSISDINHGVKGGEFSIGITSKQSAMSLSEGFAHIKYLDPPEGNCIITIGAGILKNSKNRELADEFISFISSDDVEQFLIRFLNISPPDNLEVR